MEPDVKERLEIVQHAENHSLRETAEEFGCSHGKVQYWKQRYEEEGIKGLETKKRSGRPPILTEEQKGALYAFFEIMLPYTPGYESLRDLAGFAGSVIEKATGKRYSLRHIYRVMDEAGLKELLPTAGTKKKGRGPVRLETVEEERRMKDALITLGIKKEADFADTDYNQ